MATCRRPSELASLKIDASHFSISPSTARFIPSRLSKTDRPGHMGPPIYIYRFLADPSLCPVEAIQTLISTRSGLKLQHPYLFFSSSPPFSALSPPAFSRLLAGVLRHADVHSRRLHFRHIPEGCQTGQRSAGGRLVKCDDLLPSLLPRRWSRCPRRPHRPQPPVDFLVLLDTICRDGWR